MDRGKSAILPSDGAWSRRRARILFSGDSQDQRVQSGDRAKVAFPILRRDAQARPVTPGDDREGRRNDGLVPAPEQPPNQEE